MNRREAKQEACRAAARMLDSFVIYYLKQGSTDYEGAGGDWTDEDFERFKIASQALYLELKRRAGDA